MPAKGGDAERAVDGGDGPDPVAVMVSPGRPIRELESHFSGADILVVGRGPAGAVFMSRGAVRAPEMRATPEHRRGQDLRGGGGRAQHRFDRKWRRSEPARRRSTAAALLMALFARVNDSLLHFSSGSRPALDRERMRNTELRGRISEKSFLLRAHRAAEGGRFPRSASRMNLRVCDPLVKLQQRAAGGHDPDLRLPAGPCSYNAKFVSGHDREGSRLPAGQGR